MIDMIDQLLAYAPFWAAVAMLFDIITGYYQAWCNYSISSKAMKLGLKRKGAEALLIIVIVIANVAITHCNAFVLPPEYADLIEGISVNGVSGYIILKEITSMCENLAKANPDLAGLPFMQRMETARNQALETKKEAQKVSEMFADAKPEDE